MANPVIQYFQTLLDKENYQGPSPVGNWLNGIVREVKPGDISVEFKVRKDFTNPMGGVHGGIISAMIDDVIGMATFSLCNEYHYTSVNLVVDFLAGTKLGDTLMVRAEVIRKGRKIINVSSTIHNQDGKIVAKATSNMGVTHIKNPFLMVKKK